MEFRVLNIIDSVTDGKLREMINNDFNDWKEGIESEYDDVTEGMDEDEENEVIEEYDFFDLVGYGDSLWWASYNDLLIDDFINETVNKSDILKTWFKLEGESGFDKEMELFHQWMWK